MTQSPRAQLAQPRRPVIKIGSAVLAGGGGQAGGRTLDRERFSALCDDVAAVADRGARLPVLVSSGAVALGVERLKLAARPREMALKQAAAAAGPSRLMRVYDDAPGGRGLPGAPGLSAHPGTP